MSSIDWECILMSKISVVMRENTLMRRNFPDFSGTQFRLGKKRMGS